MMLCDTYVVCHARVCVYMHSFTFVFLRRKKKRVKGKDQLFDSSTKRNGTLGRKNTDPESEWDKVIAENGVEAVQMRHKGSSKDIDIIHNVPLDPRASVEQPLYVPKESEVVPVTLQRAKVGMRNDYISALALRINSLPLNV